MRVLRFTCLITIGVGNHHLVRDTFKSRVL